MEINEEYSVRNEKLVEQALWEPGYGRGKNQ